MPIRGGVVVRARPTAHHHLLLSGVVVGQRAPERSGYSQQEHWSRPAPDQCVWPPSCLQPHLQHGVALGSVTVFAVVIEDNSWVWGLPFL